jgi:predicted transcriptional regulator
VVKLLENMSSTELKLQIISKITSITDELILEEIYKLVSLESEMDSLYRLTDAERSAIAEGLEDVKEGRVYSSEAAENMIKEWLGK